MKENAVRKGEVTQSRIVEAAYHLFLKQGYHGTSMRQIVDHAGITMGGIYNHFPNKEAIWEAVIITKHPYYEIFPVLQSVEDDTVAGFVRQAARRLVDELGKREDLLNLMFIELVEFNGKHIPSLFKAILPEAMRLANIFSAKEGNLKAIPQPILARSFAGLFFSYYITDILLPTELKKFMGDDPLGDFINIYLHGILDEAGGQA